MVGIVTKGKASKFTSEIAHSLANVISSFQFSL